MSLFRTRRFMPLFLVQAIAAFSDNLLKNALIMLAAWRGLAAGPLSGGQLVTAAAAVFVLPFFLFSATAGQLADHYAKSRLTRISRAIEIALAMLAAAALVTGSGALLFAVLLLMGVQAAFYSPLKYGMLPELLAPGELAQGNAWIEGSTFVAILLGTIAGNLLALQPGGPAMIGGLLVALAAAGWLISLLIPGAAAAAPDLRIGWNLAAEIGRMLRLAAGHPAIFRAILGISWFWLLGSVFLILFPIYVRDTLRGAPELVTLLLAMFSIGILAGSLLGARLLRGGDTLRPVPWAALAIALAALDLLAAWPAALPPAGGPLMFMGQLRGWRILADLAVISVAGGVFSLPFYVRMQRQSPDRERARLVGANNIVNALAMVAASGLASLLLAAKAAPEQAFALVGGLTLATAIRLRGPRTGSD